MTSLLKQSLGVINVGLAQFAVAAPGTPPPPLWFDIVGFALMIPAGAAGGLVARITTQTAA